MKITRVVLALVVVGLTGWAQAYTLVQTKSIDEYQPNHSSSTLDFNYFDTGGGARTLTSVTIETTLETWGGSYSVDNDSVNPTSGTASMGTTASITSSDPRLAGATTTLSALTTKTFNLTATTGDPTDQYNVTGQGDWDTIAGPTKASRVIQSTGVQTLTHPGDFTGSGQFTVTYASDAYNDFSGGNVQGAFTARSAQGEVTITYTYSGTELPVPEPVSLALFGIGGLVVALRRRFSKKA